MALLIVTLILTLMTGAYYFGRPITKRVWLVLFALSIIALIMELLSYRSLGF
jgi:hypothetical protein